MCMKATPEGCELRDELKETKAAVASLDTRLTKVENDVGSMRSETQEGIRALTASAGQLPRAGARGPRRGGFWGNVYPAARQFSETAGGTDMKALIKFCWNFLRDLAKRCWPALLPLALPAAPHAADAYTVTLHLQVPAIVDNMQSKGPQDAPVAADTRGAPAAVRRSTATTP